MQIKPETNYLPSSCPLVTARLTPAGVVYACRFDRGFLRQAMDECILEADTGCPLVKQCKLASPWPRIGNQDAGSRPDSCGK